MGAPAPKPANFDELTRTWDDPEAFARERAAYYAQVHAQRRAAGDAAIEAVDWTEPRRG